MALCKLHLVAKSLKPSANTIKWEKVLSISNHNENKYSFLSVIKNRAFENSTFHALSNDT